MIAMRKVSRYLLTLLCMMVLMLSIALGASAERTILKSGALNSSVSYVLYSDGQLVISGTGETTCYMPFRYYSEDIKTVVIEEGITNIEHELFAECEELTSVTIPSSVETIRFGAFEGCKKLTSVTFAEGLTTIGSRAFEDCTGLTSVSLPKGLTNIDNNVFRKCTGLKKVTMPDTVTSMGIGVFEECTALTSVTLSKKLTEIPEDTFYNCAALKKISLHKGITTIGSCAFFFCEGLESITLPNTLTTIYDFAFSRSTAIDIFILPKSVTTLAGASYVRHLPKAKTLVILNKDLEISATQADLDNTVVVGYPGSAAEEIVKNRNATFRSIYCEAPKLTSISNTAAGVHIKWKASANATTYTVLRKASAKDKWTAVKTVNAPTLKLTDSSAKAGTQYIYSVRANNDWVNGKYDKNGLTVTRLAVPKVTAAKSTAKGVQISWSGVSGAKTYEVYRNKKFVAEVTGKSYIDSAVLQYGKSYTYYIAAKSAIGSTSANSNEIKAAVKYVSPAVATLSVPKKDQIKVTWQKISGADKYVVYRSTDAKTGFKKIATTTSNAYTDKTVKFGTLYYYKVQTIDGAKKSESAVVKIRATIPAPAFSTTVNVTSKSVNLTWNKVSDASGYYLYIQSGSTWKKIATIKKNATTSYTYSTKTGQTFKVVAYITKSGKTYTSEGCVAYFTPLNVATSVDVSRYNEEVSNKVTWKAVKNATAYQVYRKITSSGDWKYMKTVEENQYIKSVQRGKFFYWKVKAICEKDGYTSVGEYSSSMGLIIYQKPNFSGFVSDKVSTTKWAIIIVENKGDYDLKIKSSGARIWNGSNYPNLNGSMSLTKSENMQYTNSVTIKPGENKAVCFYIDGPKSAYKDSNTRLTFYFDYNGVSYKATTNPQKYGVNKTTYEKVGYVDN